MHQLLTVYRKIPRWLITTVFIAAVIIFFVLYLKNTDFSQLAHLNIHWGWIIVGSFWLLVSLYLLVYIWRVILRALGSKRLPPFITMEHIYAKAWISRYIPGTITWIAGKIYMASSQGISKSTLAVASLLEGGMQVVATTVVSLIILGFNPHINAIPLLVRVIVIAVSVACLIVLFPPIFNRALRSAYTLLRRRKANDDLRINGKAIVRSFFLFAIQTIVNGTGAYFLVLAVDPAASISLYFYIIGAFGLAGAVGIAVPFVPSGLGIRDGALLILLSAVMPKDIAVALTVFTRLWFAVIDVAFLGITTLRHTYASRLKEASR